MMLRLLREAKLVTLRTDGKLIREVVGERYPRPPRSPPVSDLTSPTSTAKERGRNNTCRPLELLHAYVVLCNKFK